jgi:hypothetical protein
MPKKDFLQSELEENISKELNENKTKVKEPKQQENPADQEYPTDNVKSSSGPEEKDITG